MRSKDYLQQEHNVYSILVLNDLAFLVLRCFPLFLINSQLMDIEITNLNLNLIDADIQRLFVPYGEISSVKIVRDKFNNRSRGKAIVKMPVAREAQRAIASLHGYKLLGKVIAVTELPDTDELRFYNAL